MNWDGINRRRFLRAEFPYTIHIFSQKGRSISTYTEDISGGGVKVVVREQLEVLEEVDLKIYVKGDFVRCKGKVVWVKEKPSPVLDGVVFYNAGIEFGELTEDDKKIIDVCVEELKKARELKKGKKRNG
ncbi:MAG: PilZ domain-containing protein [Candidatus Omnitrophica bacterium]|nr:PilZ domain-containing protein [Candidatus Omnitrophota bacterium]